MNIIVVVVSTTLAIEFDGISSFAGNATSKNTARIC